MINVEEGQFYIILADCNTGIVLKFNGERNIGGKTPYEVFDSFEDAENYSYQKINEISYAECNIYNVKGELVKTITKN